MIMYSVFLVVLVVRVLRGTIIVMLLIFFSVHVPFAGTEFQAFTMVSSHVNRAKVSLNGQCKIGRIMCAFEELRAMWLLPREKSALHADLISAFG